MEKDIKNNIEDSQFRDLLSGTRLEASDNLKFRIMQQIGTEKALSKQQASKTRSGFGNILSILGVMYSLIAILGIGVYFTYGSEALTSPSLYMPFILITSACSVFLFISTFDDRRHSKHKK